MPTYDQGITTPFDYLGVIPVEVAGIAINFFANRTPLYSRLPSVGVGSMSFKVTSDNFRPTTTTINEGGTYSNSDVTLTVTDGSSFQVGDEIEIESEALLVTAVSGNDLTVTRGYAGTSAATHADGTTVYLLSNTRTGAEIDAVGISRVPATIEQYCQTFQHPYQVGGALASATDYALPPGVPSFVGRERMYAMQNCADDIERATYYGRGVQLAASTTRPAMKGLRTLISTNNVTSPTNAAAYKPSDLIRDTVQKCYDGGGNPDILVVSTDWMQAFSIWGHAAQRLQAGATMFGTPIDVFEVPFLNGLSVIPAPLLRTGSVICLSSGEIRMRTKRAMFDKPRGSRGDATEGDILAECAVEVDNQTHHAYVSGVTGYSAA